MTIDSLPEKEEEPKIDPGVCPVCGHPICCNISFICPSECILNETPMCRQKIDKEICNCNLNDILSQMYGLTSDDLNIALYATRGKKEKWIKKYIKQINLFLSEDLFEI